MFTENACEFTFSQHDKLVKAMVAFAKKFSNSETEIDRLGIFLKNSIEHNCFKAVLKNFVGQIIHSNQQTAIDNMIDNIEPLEIATLLNKCYDEITKNGSEVSVRIHKDCILGKLVTSTLQLLDNTVSEEYITSVFTHLDVVAISVWHSNIKNHDMQTTKCLTDDNWLGDLDSNQG